jgi:hypothetical protein
MGPIINCCEHGDGNPHSIKAENFLIGGEWLICMYSNVMLPNTAHMSIHRTVVSEQQSKCKQCSASENN